MQEGIDCGWEWVEGYLVPHERSATASRALQQVGHSMYFELNSRPTCTHAPSQLLLVNGTCVMCMIAMASRCHEMQQGARHILAFAALCFAQQFCAYTCKPLHYITLRKPSNPGVWYPPVDGVYGPEARSQEALTTAASAVSSCGPITTHTHATPANV